MERAAKESLLRSIPAFSLLVIALGAGPFGCDPAFGIKKSDAQAPVPGFDTNDFSLYQTCAGFPEYQVNVQPILKNYCYNCHRAGGAGATAYILLPNTDGTDLQADLTNYATVLSKIQGSNGSSDPGLTLFIQKMTGGRSHQGGTIVSQNSPDYEPIATWVSDENATPCVPGAGL